MILKCLNEDIEAVKKYYPNIDNDTFMKLIALDPTYREGSQSLGKYGKWILNLFKKGAIEDDEFETITPLLNQFTTYRNRVQNKDLNAYKSISELSDVLASVVDDDSMLTPRQKVRFLKNVKSGKVKVSAEDDYDVVFENGKFVVYVPNTHESSMKLGKGTKWCTAHENPEWYNNYTSNDGKLYIIKHKFSGERWQYSDKEGDFLDENDEEFDIHDLLNEDKGLRKFLMKMFGLTEDGVFIYTGDKRAPDYCTGAVIQDGVTEIKADAFRGLDSLKSIVVPEGVTFIDDYAFYYCRDLKYVSLPNSLRRIGKSIFGECDSLQKLILTPNIVLLQDGMCNFCVSLKEVEIPNGIFFVGDNVFANCKSLTSVVIPQSIRSIGDSMFYNSGLQTAEVNTNIGNGMFNSCSDLHTVVVHNASTIGKKAFYRCENLTSVYLPYTIYDIDESAFDGCDANKLTIYSNSDFVKWYCETNLLECKPNQNESKHESFRKPLKLRIRE